MPDSNFWDLDYDKNKTTNNAQVEKQIESDFFDLSNAPNLDNQDISTNLSDYVSVEQKEERGLLGNLGGSLASGGLDIVGGINALPPLIARGLYNLGAIPQNAIAELFNIDSLKASYNENIADVPVIKDVDQFFIGRAEKAFELSDDLSTTGRYEKDMLTNLQEGNYSKLGGQLFYSAVETAPQLLAMYFTAGLGGSASTGNMLGQSATKASLLNNTPSILMGGSSAGREFVETADDENLTENEKIINSLAKGGAEAIWEQVWTLPLINKINAGDEVAEEIAEGFFNEALYFGKKFTKNALGESFEEVGTEATNILTDISMDKDTGDIGSRLFSAGAGALFTGGAMGSINTAQNIRYNRNARNLQQQQSAQIQQDINQNIEDLNDLSTNTPAESWYNENDIQKPIDTSNLERDIPGLEDFFNVSAEENLNTPQIDTENIDLTENIDVIERTADMSERNLENVGSRKINAYQYENPEIKPFYQEMANQLLGDLQAGTKGGQRIPIRGEDGYIEDWTGQTRFMSETITDIKEDTGASYADIEDALNRIIEDKGLENRALAKRIELILDDKLTNGYKAWGGYDIPPNQEYIQVKQQIEQDMGVDAVTDGSMEISEQPLESREQPTQQVEIEGNTVDMSVSALSDSKGNYIVDGDTFIELPEIVEIAETINEGKTPSIVKGFRSEGTQGQFVIKGDNGQIQLRADIFTGPMVEQVRLKPSSRDTVLNSLEAKYIEGDYKIETFVENGKEFAKVYQIDPTYAPKVLAHEIGHLVDWLPDKTLTRGNILGRIKSLKSFLETTMEEGNMNRDQIMGELKRLTQQWKPFNPEIDQNYTQYRYHSAELYADAISVLVNDPQMLQKVAPNFYESFMKNLDRKPEFKAAYEDIQRRMQNRKNLTTERARKKIESYQEGIDKRLQMIKDRQEGKMESGILFLRRVLLDKNVDILQHIEKHLRDEGETGDIARKARNMLEELPYLSSEVEDYYYQAGRNIIDTLNNEDIDINTFGSYLSHNRVLNDRSDIANPGGIDVKAANEQIADIRQDLGQDKFNKLVEVAENFYDLRAERVISRIEQSRMFDPDLVEHIKNNREYVTFSIIEYLDSKHGDGTGSGIYRQYGTLKAEENPLVATLLKDASLLASINVNEAKQSTVVALREFAPDIITEADTKLDKNIMKYVPVKPSDSDMELFTFMVDGNLAGYYVPREIADTFKHDPYTANAATNVLSNLTQAFKNLWVSRNPAWMIANVPRDFINTVKNNPEIKVRDIPKLAKKYGESFPEAWREIRRGERSEDISYMRRNRMLTTDRMYRAKDIGTEAEVLNSIEGILNNIDPDQIQESNKAVKAMKKVWDFLGDVGQTSEMAGQLGGFKYLRENIDIATEDLGHRVRTRVGTPNFKRRGKWHHATNNIFVFSNIRKEGWRAAAEAYGDNPASYLWKTTVLTILPKLMQIGLQYIGELFPDSEKAKEISEIMEGISEYKKKNYLVIPLYKDDNGKAHALTLPQDFTGQFLSALLYDMAQSNATDAGGTVLGQSPYNPSSLNPLIKLGIDTYQFASGNNVYDFYRGRNVISEEAMALGGTDKFKEFLSYEAQQGGISTFVNPNIQYADTTAEKLLQIMPFNSLGRFYTISDAGYKEDINKLYEEQQRVSAIVDKYREQMRQSGQSNMDINMVRDAANKLSMYNRITQAFSGGRRKIQSIESDDSLTEEQKRQQIKEVEMQMVNLARRALNKEPIDFNN